MQPLQVEAVAPQDLGPQEWALWDRFVASGRGYESPYFHPAYIRAAGEVTPNAGVAVLRRGGRVEGFLPFQRRQGLVQPLAAPMTDYHGPVARPGAQIDLAEVVAQLDADRFRFSGLRLAAPLGLAAASRPAMTADLSQGYGAYLARRKGLHRRFFKTKARLARALERDHGTVSFSFSREDEGALDWILARKRAQYRRTARHDIFRCGWTEALLRLLVETADADFGPRFAVLRAGDRIVSAEMSLAAGGVCHLWFPAYDLGFARYAPGMLMTLRTLEAFAREGGRVVDFGAGGEPYKAYFADPADSVLQGVVAARASRRTWDGAAAAVTRCAPMLARARESYVRRFDVVAACETTRAGWLKGAAGALKAAASSRGRRPAEGPAGA